MPERVIKGHWLLVRRSHENFYVNSTKLTQSEKKRETLSAMDGQGPPATTPLRDSGAFIDVHLLFRFFAVIGRDYL